MARRIAAMLDLDPDDFHEGSALPRGWHFVLMGADTRRSLLRADGYPGPGVPLPDLGLPRLLLGGRTVTFNHDVPIGSRVGRHSFVESIVQKDPTPGPAAVITIGHELTLEGHPAPAILEKQWFHLLPAERAAGGRETRRAEVSVADMRVRTITPDETLLFQYSALGFNSHRIHLDRDYARDVEGYPDLVVNGGLITLLLTEFLLRDAGVCPAQIRVRHRAPLFCRRQITLAARQTGSTWSLMALDESGRMAAEMEVDGK
jgi:3-methylfumaryl-CoA hydratase